ncbi:helix-turn-helix domain-containing protein [Amycolatopsis sp. NPDC049868]|uniref:helix-turn-helix domain-containing protein n=1 Tax=Amycolatopsis sp. NPDC049868 TaxID=3363934 RepID=UPI0037B7CFB2
MTMDFESRDLEEIQEFCSASYASSRFSGRQEKPHRVRVTQSPLGPVSLDWVDFGCEVDYLVDPLGRFVVLGVESGSFPRWEVGGVRDSLGPVGPGEVFLGALPDRPFAGQVSHARYSCALVVPSLLSRVAATAPGDTGEPVRLTGHRPISPAAGRHLSHTIAFLRDQVGMASEIRDSPLIVSTATQLLAATILATFPNTGLAEPTIEDRHDSHPATLRRAVAFIDDHVREDISVADVAVAAHTTIRAVQYAFRRHAGTTPMSYLRRVRLQHAHEELLAADPATGVTVTGIAAGWGFFHPGRFAHQYRTAYGCQPYQSLQREDR